MVWRPADQELVTRGCEVKGRGQVTTQGCQSGAVGCWTWEKLERVQMRFNSILCTWPVTNKCNEDTCNPCFYLKSFEHLACSSQSCCWCGFRFTIENLQHIKLSLSVKAFKRNGHVVSFLHSHAPGAHLQVWVALRPTWAQDDTRWIIAHLMRRALHCGQTMRRNYALADLTSKHWLQWQAFTLTNGWGWIHLQAFSEATC